MKGTITIELEGKKAKMVFDTIVPGDYTMFSFACEVVGEKPMFMGEWRMDNLEHSIAKATLQTVRFMS
jgi:hypothetical protein